MRRHLAFRHTHVIVVTMVIVVAEGAAVAGVTTVVVGCVEDGAVIRAEVTVTEEASTGTGTTRVGWIMSMTGQAEFITTVRGLMETR